MKFASHMLTCAMQRLNYTPPSPHPGPLTAFYGSLSARLLGSVGQKGPLIQNPTLHPTPWHIHTPHTVQSRSLLEDSGRKWIFYTRSQM